jgi:hypothetical protein
MKNQTVSGFFAVLFAADAPPLRADRITFSQAADPFIALEGTSGNLGFITLKNNDPDHIAFLTNILAFQCNATGGEPSHQATNMALTAPNPTAHSPVQIGPNGTATIKFNWDAAGNIKDNGVGSGDWAPVFTIDYHDVKGTDFLTIVRGNVRAADAPVLLVTGRYRFTSRPARQRCRCSSCRAGLLERPRRADPGLD